MDFIIDKNELFENIIKNAIENSKSNFKDKIKCFLKEDEDKKILRNKAEAYFKTHFDFEAVTKFLVRDKEQLLSIFWRYAGYRRFTPCEVARILSFPEQFSLVETESAQYCVLGNAIPLVMFWYVAKEVGNIVLRG